MRIIGGTHRRRQILAPRDSATTRPITDRVKQSLFDRLWSSGLLGDSPVEFGDPDMVGGGNVLDLFSGTGSLGIEALSRGADHCAFIEKDRDARELLQKNLTDLNLAEQAGVLSSDILSSTWVSILPRKPLRLIFLDPPYRMSEDPKDLARLAELMATLAATPGAIEKGGTLMLRTSEYVKPPAIPGWAGPESVGYGSMAIHFYVR